MKNIAILFCSAVIAVLLTGWAGMAKADGFIVNINFAQSQDFGLHASGMAEVQVINLGSELLSLDVRSADGIVTLGGNGVVQLGNVASGTGASASVEVTAPSDLAVNGGVLSWRIDYVRADGSSGSTVVQSTL